MTYNIALYINMVCMYCVWWSVQFLGGILLVVSLISVMIASWYQFAVFVSDDVADDSTVADDHEIINELNEELDWWEYQEIAWLIIGVWVCVHVCCILFSGVGIVVELRVLQPFSVRLDNLTSPAPRGYTCTRFKYTDIPVLVHRVAVAVFCMAARSFALCVCVCLYMRACPSGAHAHALVCVNE